ncbi:DNA adenine methylase [Zunongwangia profunda]|uniref:DNA adenine methylase n=1 Tax=Zunongwangia profunda TaxID=398743 RepID=UPI001D18641A|nr:DNA adenine methylase [Zunongwangia profunda]MCC4228399.1 DNA adenine methylase [Zunongwangia profunda]
MSTNSKHIIAFNYFGGKYTWLSELYKYIPKHDYFLDLFCGYMAFTLNKEPSLMDTANDIDGDIFNFFNILRNHPDELFRQLYLTPVSRKEYNNATPIFKEGISDLERARRFFVRCRMSFQGSGLKSSTGFNSCIKTSEKGVSKNVSKYLSAVEKLPQVVDRLKNIQIENKQYAEMLDRVSDPEYFIYVDPPYELRTRKYKKWYSNEFTDEDHQKLAEKLHQNDSMIMISHSKSDMYNSLYKDWNYIELPARGHSMKGAKSTTECIWINYPMSQTRIAQLQLQFDKN